MNTNISCYSCCDMDLYVFLESASRLLKWTWHVYSKMYLCTYLQIFYLNISIISTCGLYLPLSLPFSRKSVGLGHWRVSSPFLKNLNCYPQVGESSCTGMEMINSCFILLIQRLYCHSYYKTYFDVRANYQFSYSYV